MKRATEKAMSSAGLNGTAPPNSVNLVNYLQIHTHTVIYLFILIIYI